MISVIIPVKDGGQVIRECLQAVASQRGLDDDYEVIVVDDGSTDATAEIAREYGVRVISQPNAGAAAARNTGARAARGEILAFTDADCSPTPDWLFQLTAPFNDPGVVAAKGSYLTRQRSLVARFVQLEYESKYARMARMQSIDFIDTYSAGYLRSVFLQNSGFNPAFPVPSVEDQEFSFRLARKGYRMVFVPQAKVYHLHDRSLAEYIRRKFNIGYWKVLLLRWLPEKILDDSHTPTSERFQILLLGLALLALIAGIFLPSMLWVSLTTLFLFGISALPFLAQTASCDPAVLPAAPLLLILRAASLGAGLVTGLLFPPKARSLSRIHMNWSTLLVKRCLDLLGGLVGLLVSAPIILFAATAIKLEDGGAVFFGQDRVGENGRVFRIHKLRSMQAGAEDRVDEVLDQNGLSGPVYKIPNDPRVTRVGRFLRRWSLDELPQFWNVVRGEMSLVGPRPEEVRVAAKYSDSERQRFAFKPGMTGPMQVSGRGCLDLDARLTLELEYMDNYSIWRDLTILFRSIPAILTGKGAY